MKGHQKEKKISRGEFIAQSLGCVTGAVVTCPILGGLLSSCGSASEDDSSLQQPVPKGNQVILDLTLEKYQSLQNVGGVVALSTGDEENLPERGLIVYRKSSTQVVAYGRICPHSAGLVNIGSSSNLGKCSLHGAEFNGEGQGVSGPASGDSLLSYEVSLEAQKVTIQV